MSQSRIHLETRKGLLDLATGRGWRLRQSGARVVTNRGPSVPLEHPVLRLGLRHQWHVRRLSASALEFHQTLHNTASDALLIKRIEMFTGYLELAGAGWNLMHSELFKVERYFGGYSLYTRGLFAPLPGTEGEFGISEDTPFPGLFFTHPERGTLLMAVLSQERCKPCWKLTSEKHGLHLTATDQFHGVDAIPVRPATWLSVATLFYRGDCLLADSDSIGWAPTLSEEENRAWATVALMTGGMCEIGGDATRLTPASRRLLRTAIQRFGPSQRCTNTVGQPGLSYLPCTQWIRERSDGRSAAWINWLEYPMEIHLARASREIWTGKRLSAGRQVLPRHGVVLVEG